MTKMEVRNTVMSYLELHQAQTVLDLGAGTGSVSVAIARCFPHIHVTAIEKNPSSCELIRTNAQNHAVKIDVICGQAPLPDRRFQPFDRVYVGGSGGDIPMLMHWLEKTCLKKGTILVFSLITLENVSALFQFMKGNSRKYTDMEGSHIQASRLEPLGDYHYFKPLNGAYVIKCVYGGQGE